MKIYFLAHRSDQLLCYSENNDPNEKRQIIGAFHPGIDGNYYREVISGFVTSGELQYTLGIQAWWEWCKTALTNDLVLMDDKFTFDVNKVRIVTAELNMEQ